jgi:peptidoglycan hydrolase CwlO-like protein
MMRNKLITLVVVPIAAVLSSCGGKSSFEADVRKMANYRCKTQQLMAKEATDEKVKKELDDLQKEMEAYTKKMKEKYKDIKDDKEMEERADKIMQEVMSKCK